MRGKRLRLFAAFAALTLAPAFKAGAGQAVVESAWAGQPVTIDGSRDDWQGTPLADWKKGAAGYAFRNDGETLFILFVVKDPKYRSTIEENGVTLFFDAQGGKAKDHGLLFKKVRLDPEGYIAYLEKTGPVSENEKAGIRRKAGFILFHHQVLDRKGRPLEASGGPAARPALFKYAPGERGEVVYEFAVPLARPSDTAAGVGAGPGQTVAVGFAWGGETEAMRKAAAKRLREQASVANEELEGGERPIIGSVGSGPAPKKHDFWAILKLVKDAG